MIKEESRYGSLMNRATVQINRTITNLLFSKWIFIAFPIILIPFFIALYTVFDKPEDAGNWPETFIIFGILLFQQILILMFTLIYGTSMMNDEMESRTITYLFLRASKRFEVLIYKFIGINVVITLLFSISVLATYFTLSTHTSMETMNDHLVLAISLVASLIFGAYAYIGIFSFLGVLFKRPLVVGLIYSFFWEVFMVNMPLNVQQLTVMYYIRSIFLGTHTVRQYTDITERASVPGSILVLSIVGTVFLILASFVISRKDVN